MATATMFGVSRSALIGQRFSRYIVKTQQDTYYLYNQRLLSSGEPQTFELQMLKADGSQYWVSVNAVFAQEERGTPVQRLVLNDVTNAKVMASAMQNSEERYRNLFNSIDAGFCVIEKVIGSAGAPLDFRYLEVNPAFAAQSGVVNVVGKTIRELLPDEPEDWYVIYDTVCRTGKPLRFERELLARERVLELYAFRVGPAENCRVAVLFYDITKRRQNEAERLRLARVLREKNLELEEAREVSEKANLAKSAFLSSMSHELRTPLNAILGFAQLLRSGPTAATAEQGQKVDQILKAGWYLLELINEILELTLIESGKLSLTIETVSLVVVMHECEAMIEPQALGRGIRMSFPESGKPYLVQADRIRIKQILLNLLSNAIKYNKVGGSVDVNIVELGATRVRICVQDTGEGLDALKIAQLFEPFNRLGREANTEEGTGIGLVMTKRLAQLMGGVIGVESTVGRGSVFWVEMNLLPVELLQVQAISALNTEGNPVVNPEVDVAGSSELHVELQRVGAPSGLVTAPPVYTVIYIEDDEATLILVEYLAAQHPGLRLLTACDAMSGIDMVRSLQPDVILMDVNLPGINGYDALRILQRDPLMAGIPVVAISANAFSDDIKRGLAAGFFRYVTKPFEVDDFMQTLLIAGQFSRTRPARQQ
jgi:PAS domain S-box-containing protein